MNASVALRARGGGLSPSARVLDVRSLINVTHFREDVARMAQKGARLAPAAEFAVVVVKGRSDIAMVRDWDPAYGFRPSSTKHASAAARGLLRIVADAAGLEIGDAIRFGAARDEEGDVVQALGGGGCPASTTLRCLVCLDKDGVNGGMEEFRWGDGQEDGQEDGQVHGQVHGQGHGHGHGQAANDVQRFELSPGFAVVFDPAEFRHARLPLIGRGRRHMLFLDAAKSVAQH